VLGRKLDVPPSLIAVWRAEEERENIDQLSISPRTWLAREFAGIKQRERQARQKLNDPRLGVKAWSAAQTVLSQCARQRLVLLERAGISLELPPSPAEIPIDERGLHHLLSLKASLAEIMVAAGVDPHTPLEDAAAQFGDALDRNFGPVGSEGRAELSASIKRGFKRGREVVGITGDEEAL
jgi:hypothetical protein